jgi:hypothetical protein
MTTDVDLEIIISINAKYAEGPDHLVGEIAIG